MKNFKKTCLQPVLLAMCLITVCGSANAADNNVEEPTVVAIHAKYLHSLFLMSDGSLWGAGSNLTGALGGNGFVHPTPWIIINDVSAASAGKLHSLFLKKDGSVWAVGWVGSGALGDGFSVDLEKNPADLYGQKKGEGIQRITPVRVMEGGAAISAGWGHSLFLKQDGSVWASGENEDGRLGDGTTSDKSSSVPIMQEVAAISAGFGHSLFLKKDGSAWATGLNDQGQLGDGTTTNRTKPVQVMTDVAAISAGGNHSLFLKKDGTVWASGQNDDGRLGDGTKTNQRKPVPVLTKVAAISAGDVHSLFLKNDGSAWGTGDNRFGQLGDALWDLYPADRHVTSPLQVIDGVSSVCAGDNYSLFLMRDGSVRASGHNMFNNLGFKGSSTSKPTKISFRRRTPSEIKEAEKARDEIPVDPEKHLPILTKPPRAAFGATGVQVADHPTQIAVSVLDEEHGGIYVVNADGSGKQRLTNGSRDILPRWSPDGEQIAFLALREQDHELAAEHDLAFHWFLYVMDADGHNQRRVTKTPIGMIFQWSPDGSRFVFQSSWEDKNNKGKDGTVSSAIYVIKADGTQQKRLTPVENNDGFPSWSYDGKQIAFCSNQHGNLDIFVMNADGSEDRRLTRHRANDFAPTWSPDGKQIAFTSPREDGNAFVMNADGTEESSLIVRGRPVAWSPDGQSLLLENDGQLVLGGADGRNQKDLTKAGEPALDAEYSPDGKAIFYRSKVNGTWTLMSVDTERSSPKRIWSDSGKLLGFSVSPSHVSLAKDSMSLSTANTHLTEFGNACRKSEKRYEDSRQQLLALIPDFLDWKRREIEIPYSSTTNAFEVRVIFTPPDGTKAHVAVLVSGNRHLVQSRKVDVPEAEPIIVWGASTILTEAEYGRYDGHLLKQAAFVLEGNLADKDSLDDYLESIDFKRIGKFVSSRLTRNAK
jgi:alpha-tubulin suppressor-like RCC1 family protein/Tol biopolymer transport system component